MSAIDAPANHTHATRDELFRELLPDILVYCVRRIADRDDAADAAAETLLVLWRRRADIPTEHTEARRWSFGVAHKVLSNARRGRRRREALAAQIVAELSATPTPADSVVDLDLRTALGKLSPQDRDLILLVAWEGLSVADAGRTLGLRPDAALARTRETAGTTGRVTRMSSVLRPTGVVVSLLLMCALSGCVPNSSDVARDRALEKLRGSTDSIAHVIETLAPKDAESLDILIHDQGFGVPGMDQSTAELEAIGVAQVIVIANESTDDLATMHFVVQQTGEAGGGWSYASAIVTLCASAEWRFDSPDDVQFNDQPCPSEYEKRLLIGDSASVSELP